MSDNTTVLLKACQKCLKQTSNFHKDVTKKDGLCTKCKDCVKAYCAATREVRNVYARQWQTLNPEKAGENASRWREAHPEYKEKAKNRYAEKCKQAKARAGKGEETI